MKKKILLLMLFIPILCVASVCANEDIKVFNNNEYVEFLTPPVFVDGTIMAPAQDLINARIDWKATYYPDEHSVIGYFKLGSSLRFVEGDKTFCYTDITGKENYYEFSVVPQQINNRLYIPVRGFYENVYNYNVEWRAEEKEVYTYLYNIPSFSVASNDDSYDYTMYGFDVTYAEETIIPGELEVCYRYYGIRNKGRNGGMYIHFYDREGKYLKSQRLAMRSSDEHDEFLYANYFYIPKEAHNIYFSIDKVTPTKDPFVYWRNIW